MCHGTTLDTKLGFDIGYDYSRFGLELPLGIRESESELPPAIFQGHGYGREKYGQCASTADRYTRKWLQLRVNAWRRQRHFDAGVTPDFLRTIDVKFCPVTREVLTYGTGTESDWSVDRLYNSAGYAPGNLAVTSTRANHAKGRLTTAGVIDLLQGDNPRAALDPALSPAQWCRQINIMALSDPHLPPEVTACLPMVVLPPPRTLCHSPYTAFQILLSAALLRGPTQANGDSMQSVVSLVQTKKVRRDLLDLTKTLFRVAYRHWTAYRQARMPGPRWLYAIEDAWTNDVIAHQWERIVRKTSVEQFLPALKTFGTSRPRHDAFDGWGIENGGYDPPCRN